MFAALVLSLFLQAAPPPLPVVATESMSMIDSRKEAVVRTPEEWAALWKQHSTNKAAPMVDLSSRTIVAVFLGSRPSAGYGVDIVGTRQDGNALVVQWRERRPGPDQVAAEVITSPMQAVSLPKFSGEIRFEKVDK